MSLTKQQRVDYIKDYAKIKGFSSEFTAGLLGNIQREVGPDFSPYETNPNEKSYGLFQYYDAPVNKDRIDAFLDYIEKEWGGDPKRFFKKDPKILSAEKEKELIKDQLDFAFYHDVDKSRSKLMKLSKSKDLEAIKKGFAGFERFRKYKQQEGNPIWDDHNKFINEWYSDITSPSKKSEEDSEDKYQIPAEKSQIPAWMKKHDWKGSDIGKMVDGKWKGYHPGDTMTPKKEKEESGVGAAGAEAYLETETDFLEPKIGGYGPGYAYPDLETYEASQETEEEDSDKTYYDDESYEEDPSNITSEWTNLGGGGSVEEPKKKSKYEQLRERQRLEAQLRKHEISYKFKKKKKNDLTIDELLDMPFSHGGPVKKYFEGGASLVAEGGGGTLPEEDYTKYSVEELQVLVKRFPTDDVRRTRINELIGKRMDAEKFEPHAGYKWGGQKDPTGMGASFEEIDTVEYDEEGVKVPTETEKRDSYLKMRGLPIPTGGEEIMTDTTKLPSSVEPSIMEATVEDSFRVEDEAKAKAEKKKPVEEDIQPKKTQVELDLERQRDEQKKDAAYMDMQKDLIKSQIKAFNDEQEELVKIDPDRFWKSKGTISKIAAILGSAGGAYISAKYGGKNVWDEMIIREVNKDMDAQKLDRDSQIKKKAAALKRVEMLIKHYEFMTKDKTAKANLRLIESKIKNERMKVSVSYNKEKLAANDALLMKNGLKDEELAVMDIRYPKQNIRRRAVKSTKDGK